MRFRNPILPGFYPDPSVCRVGGDYYLVCSSFEYFPGLPIFHSRDLVNWAQLGHVLDRPSQLPLAGCDASAGLYAPTLRHHGGKFWLTCTNVSAGGNFIVSADKAEGPWSEPLYIAQKGIDPSLFWDDNGDVLYTTSHFGALQSKLDLTTGKLLSEPTVVWKGTGAQHTEGPHLLKKDGWYYLLMAEGGTEYGHMVVMARSHSAWGPFEAAPRNPLLTHRSRWSPIQALGHADLVQTPQGAWFAVCLGIRPNSYPPCYHLGRETFLMPVTWHADGFPVFGDGDLLTLEMEGALAEQGDPAPSFRDDFDDPALAPRWNRLREPKAGLLSLTERPGFLRLHGSPAGLDDKAAPAWLGVRQRHFKLRAAASLRFQPSELREEAGLCVRMNEKHHYELFLTLRRAQPTLVLRRRIGSLQAEVATQTLPAGHSGPIVLALEADRDRYRFLFGLGEEAPKLLGEGETRYLSTEVAGGFTGVYLALYASGNGARCAGPADFDWFEYQGLPD
jgi:alpha-N-arabinofuranosidase